LSDRLDTAKTERIKAALLPIPLAVLKDIPSVGKPFQLAVNFLKNLIAAVSIAGNSIDFDQNHSRGQIALVTTKIVSLLLAQMSRVEVLSDELKQFRIQDSDSDIYDDLSTRNARLILLSMIKNSLNIPALSNPLASFTSDTIKFFMTLPSSEIDLIRETAQVGLVMADKMPEPENLKSFINNLI